jgi:hypothetical protein
MMKKLTYLFFALVMLTAFSSCKKSGDSVNPLSSVDNLGTGSYLTLDKNINLNLDNTALATSTVGIQVTQYAGGQDIDHIDIFAAPAPSYDPTTWVKIKTVPYAGPKTSLTVTGAQLATALGKPISSFSPGTSYTFYTRITTKSGATFDVSNTGNNSGSGLITGPYYNTAFTFIAYIVCPFVGPIAGSYKVVRDDWADWSAGDIVQVTDGPGANVVNLSQVYPNGGTVVKPLLVNVDPATGTATIPKVNYGTYGGSPAIAVGTGANGLAGYVFSCTGYMTLSIDQNVGGTDYGANTLQLQKQ